MITIDFIMKFNENSYIVISEIILYINSIELNKLNAHKFL